MLSFDKTLKSYKQVITEIAKVLEYDDKDFSKWPNLNYTLIMRN